MKKDYLIKLYRKDSKSIDFMENLECLDDLKKYIYDGFYAKITGHAQNVIMVVLSEKRERRKE